MLIAFAGLPGTGKSTLSRALAGRIGAEGYGAAMALAADQLADGLAVVADSVNPVEASHAGWRAVVAGAGCPILEVEVVCSNAAEHRRRVEARLDGVPGLPRVIWARVSDRRCERWRGERLVIDTARLAPEAALPSSPAP